MLFNSFEFIFLFLPITLIIYILLNRQKLTLASKAWLVFTSLFFYSWWNIKYLPLILSSIVFNYAIGTSVNKVKGVRKKLILIAGIISNVTLLGYFKYADFFISNLNQAANTRIELPHVILPLGISFFTFTQIAFLVDSYNNESKEYNFLNYSLFVTFFPHLLAGPIIHHKEMMPQFDASRNKILNYKNISFGLYLFFIGLFKKVAIADTFAVYANNGYDVAKSIAFTDAWVTSLSYSIQLYFDFSGYTDMALGSALMFNIRLPINFNSPYKAINIQDFWRRWHMTLSRFLRDYVYIPLGGNRRPKLLILSNLMITFLIGGLWHGAGWTFIFWGFLHGLAMVMQRLWAKLNITIPKILAWVITFNFINMSWIFFRARSWSKAIEVFKGMLGMNGMDLNLGGLGLILPYTKQYGFVHGVWQTIMANINNPLPFIAVALLIIFLAKNSNEMSTEFKPGWKSVLFIGVIALYSTWCLNKVSEFLYFNF